MWIFTTSGFISAVKIDDHIIVRARDKKSLEPLAHFTHQSIKHTPLSDYPYRLTSNSKQFAQWTEAMASNIDYSNFKSEVALTRGNKFAKALSKVWSDMHDVEDSEARKR